MKKDETDDVACHVYEAVGIKLETLRILMPENQTKQKHDTFIDWR